MATKAHPGFAAVQSKIAKSEGVSSNAAGAILASATRNASPAAKKANPNLKKVKGYANGGMIAPAKKTPPPRSRATGLPTIGGVANKAAAAPAMPMKAAPMKKPMAKPMMGAALGMKNGGKVKC